MLGNLRGLIIALKEIEKLDSRKGKKGSISGSVRGTITRSITGAIKD